MHAGFGHLHKIHLFSFLYIWLLICFSFFFLFAPLSTHINHPCYRLDQLSKNTNKTEKKILFRKSSMPKKNNLGDASFFSLFIYIHISLYFSLLVILIHCQIRKWMSLCGDVLVHQCCAFFVVGCDGDLHWLLIPILLCVLCVLV